MKRYGGFIEKGYRVEAMVPTTIYDKKVAVVRAYLGKKCVDSDAFILREMPRWNLSFRAILLGKEDENILERITEDLVKRLPVIEQ